MLTKEVNEKLTKVGPGTPMGNLMRRYWHPVAASVELEENPVKKVRLLGEDLVLYQDRSGNLGLIDEPCPHRRVSMEYGIPEEEGLRCPYHGWRFNQEGQCLEQPAEPWNSTFKDRVTTKAYKVQAFAGLVFAYLGPDPAPLLPRYDLYAWGQRCPPDRGVRAALQLHAVHGELPGPGARGVAPWPTTWTTCGSAAAPPLKKGTPPGSTGKSASTGFEHGIIKRRVAEGGTEESDHWKVGHPIVFPNILRVGSTFQIRVPTDDEHTTHYNYVVYRPGIPVPPQQSIPLYEIPLRDEQDKWRTEMVLVQDFFAWASQGSIARRELERLGQSDIGVIMYRELLKEQMERVEQGEDPMGVFRDPEKAAYIGLPQEGLDHDEVRHSPKEYMFSGSHGRLDDHINQSDARYSPLISELLELSVEGTAAL